VPDDDYYAGHWTDGGDSTKTEPKKDDEQGDK
jgi:hypothetical protein